MALFLLGRTVLLYLGEGVLYDGTFRETILLQFVGVPLELRKALSSLVDASWEAPLRRPSVMDARNGFFYDALRVFEANPGGPRARTTIRA